MSRRNRHPHRQPLPLITPTLAAIAGNQRVVVQHIDTAKLSRNRAQFAIQPLSLIPLAIGDLRIQHAASRRNRTLHRMQNQISIAALAEDFQPLAQGRSLIRLHSHHHSLRFKRIERTAGVQNLLRVCVEIPQLHMQIDAAHKSRGPQHRHHRFHGKRSQNRQAVRRQRRGPAQFLKSRNHKPGRSRTRIAPPHLRQSARGSPRGAFANQPVDLFPQR